MHTKPDLTTPALASSRTSYVIASWRASTSPVLAAAATFVGAVCLGLWAAGIPPRWAAQGMITMKTNAALAVVLAGAALILLCGRSVSTSRRVVALVLSAVVLLVGTITLAEHVLGIDLGIDQLLAAEPSGAPGTAAPNRMGPPAATTLVLVGTGLITLVARRRGAALLGAVAFCVVLIPFIGRLYGVGPLYSVPSATGIAWPAVISLSLLTSGLVLVPRHDGDAPLFWHTDAGGTLLRRMMLPAVVLPPALGFVCLQGARSGVYDASMGYALFAAALVSVFLVMIWRSGVRLSGLATEQTRAQGALRESEERYRTLFTNMTEGFALAEVISDPEGQACDFRFLDMNGAFERQSGLPIELARGRPIREVLPHIEQAWIDRFCRVALGGPPDRFEMYNRDLERHFSVYCFSPAPDRFAIVFSDVTARKHADEALRHSEARLRLALEAANFGTFELDVATGRLVWDVPKIRMWGIPEDGDFRYPAVLDRIHPDDRGRVAAAVDAAFASGEYGSEYRVVWPDGSIHWLYARGRVDFEEGRPTRMLGVEVDITERKLAEEALHKANEQLRDADRRKDEFLSMLSHELRNPLAPIRSSVYVLQHDPGGDRAARARNVIDRQTEHLTRIVDDLLDVTRIARGKILLHRNRIDLGDVVARAVEDARTVIEERGVTLRAFLPEASLWAEADATRITQVIGNLLANARKFTKRGDEVVVTLREVDAMAEVSVRDTGAGIDAELLPALFDPFVQGNRTLARSEGGLGLGLSLVKGLVELHGGQVRAQSEGVGRGAEFTVELPLALGQPVRCSDSGSVTTNSAP